MSINRIATTAKGWTDNVTCYEWFTKTFIPQATARRDNPKEPIVLVLDGHASHKTPEMFRAAIDHNIEFHFLPPHTTHQLQPLDVGIFGPLQRKWQDRCDEVISETNAEIPRSQFVKEYMDVRNEVFTEELIKSAWKKAGIWPLNPQRFTEKDFAPSKLLSYAASLPPGYPELPDAPDMLMLAQDGEEGEGAGDGVGRGDEGPEDVVMGEEVGDDGGADGEGAGGDDDNIDGEGTGGDDEDHEMDENEAESDVDESDEETDDGRGDGVAGEGETTWRGVGATNDVSGDENVGRDNTPNNENQFLRYAKVLIVWIIVVHVSHSSTLPSAPPASPSSRDKVRIAELEKEVESLRSQLETALAHAICAGWEIKSLQHRLNSKSKAKNRKVQVNAQYVSSAEARRRLEEHEREQAEKRQREEEAQAAKKAKDDQRKQQREAGGTTFSGSLNSKTKDDLLDITFALKLTGSDSNTQETKASLISIINNHLDTNPHLASNPTFAGLFLSRTRGRRRNVSGEDPTPVALPSTPLPPGPICQAPPPEPEHEHERERERDTFELEPEPSLVLFDELPNAGRFFQAINSTFPHFSPPNPSPFMSYSHYPPPPASWQPTDPRFLPPYFTPLPNG